MFKISITGDPEFTWTAIIGGQVIEINLNFKHPESISLGKRDKVKIQVYREELLSDKNANTL